MVSTSTTKLILHKIRLYDSNAKNTLFVLILQIREEKINKRAKFITGFALKNDMKILFLVICTSKF